jgi:hypothetical protein
LAAVTILRARSLVKSLPVGPNAILPLGRRLVKASRKYL